MKNSQEALFLIYRLKRYIDITVLTIFMRFFMTAVPYDNNIKTEPNLNSHNKNIFPSFREFIVFLR